MNWKLNLYNKLVNEVPGIREKYSAYKQSEKSSALMAYAYLGLMNFSYHVLHRKSVGELSPGKKDEKIRIRPHFTESSLIDYGTPEKFVEKIMAYDVISFDVFDTLVFRPFANPTDLFYYLDRAYNYPGFKKLRTEAERQARVNKQRIAGHGEVSLEEIWLELEQRSGRKHHWGMQEEFSLEKKYCFANPFFKEVILLLRAKNKKLVIMSDMYLGKEYIKELLDSCGYKDFDDYIVSCDYGKSKASGELYDVLKERYGDNVIHIGDNPHSDVKMAKRKGIKAVYYANVNTLGQKYRPSDMSPLTASVYAGLVNSHLYNGLYKRDWEYEFGFIYGGLLVTGYCRFIHQYAKEHDVTKLLFLARDGDVICKAYKLMYPEEADKCEYVLWSRLAATKMCAEHYKAQFMARMVDHKVNAGYSVFDVMYTMGLMDMISLLNEESGNNDISCQFFDKKHAKPVKDFLNRHWDEVLATYGEEIIEGMQYYGEILSDNRNALIIDSGWMGSGAIMLKAFITPFCRKSTGMLIGTMSANSLESEASEALLNSGELVSYSFSSTHNRDIWKMHDASKGHNLIVELLLSSDKASFRGFSKSHKCCTGEYLFNRDSEKIDSHKVQEGILDFVGLFMEHINENLTISGRDAFYPVTVLYRNKEWVESILEETGININVE